MHAVKPGKINILFDASFSYVELKSVESYVRENFESPLEQYAELHTNYHELRKSYRELPILNGLRFVSDILIIEGGRTSTGGTSVTAARNRRRGGRAPDRIRQGKRLNNGRTAIGGTRVFEMPIADPYLVQ